MKQALPLHLPPPGCPLPCALPLSPCLPRCACPQHAPPNRLLSRQLATLAVSHHLQWLPQRYPMIYQDYDWNATIMCPEDMKVTLDFPE